MSIFEQYCSVMKIDLFIDLFVVLVLAIIMCQKEKGDKESHKWELQLM